VIATAQAAAENVKDYGIRAENIRTIINGCERIRPVSEQERAQTRQRWRIPPDAIVIGIAARLEPCKGHLIFLQAARELKKLLPQHRFCFLLAGNGSMENALKQEAKRLQIDQDVRFLGFLSDMAPFYHLLHLHVNCSMGTETSCLALSEAMSASVPCIVSDYGGNPSMVGKDGAGLVYPAGDSRALAEAVAAVISDTKRYRQMRQLALARYENHYTAERMAEQTMAIYELLYTARR
jgi:glycosyltransferase involved in cell wall biosynthesis